MATDRRLPRSRRALAALVLLLTAVAAATAGITLATVPVLVGSTVYAVLAGIVSARLLSNDLAQMRRDWSRDRAALAKDYGRVTRARAAEHVAYAGQMSDRITARDEELAVLREALLTAEIDRARSEERLADERARTEALTEDVDTAQGDLEQAHADLRRAQGELAESHSAELELRAEILAWEQASSDEARRLHERRLA